MAYCPRCRFEYREGVTHCPDCGAELVAELPPEEEFTLPTPETELVELCRMTDPNQAEVIKAALQEAGIATLLRTKGPITGELSKVVDGATDDEALLYVTRNRLAEAKEVLQKVQTAPVVWPEGMTPVEDDEGEDDPEE